MSAKSLKKEKQKTFLTMMMVKQSQREKPCYLDTDNATFSCISINYSCTIIKKIPILSFFILCNLKGNYKLCNSKIENDFRTGQSEKLFSKVEELKKMDYTI